MQRITTKLFLQHLQSPMRFQRTLYCWSSMNNQEKKPDDKETEEQKQQKIEQASFLKEVLETIRESAQESAVERSQRFKNNVKKFHEEANRFDQECGKLKTCFNWTKHAWNKTFPSHDDVVRERMEKVKKRVAEEKKLEEEKKEYTEEEIQKMGEAIPEWKKNALQQASSKQEREKLSTKLKSKLKSRLSQTDSYKKIRETEEYKEYETFKTEMSQFKEDVKDKVQNHPSNLVQGSIYLYKAATSETEIAKAIKAMRLIDPDFDLFELEKEAKIIFQNIYHTYLRSDLKNLEKVCGEMALGYFKVMLKKREAEVNRYLSQICIQKCEPKHKYLWDIQDAMFKKALVPDSTKMPCFVFTIKTQEIFCYVSTTDPKKIVDGDEERVMSMDYFFTLTPHLEPSVDEVGHSWQMVEIQPSEAIKLLV